MLAGLYIIVDDDINRPIYGDPDSGELEPVLWETAVEALQDALEDDGPTQGVVDVSEHRVGWRIHTKMGVAFIAIVHDEVSSAHLKQYLKEIQSAYFDEVDDARNPDREGVEDVIIDVVAPWEDDEED